MPESNNVDKYFSLQENIKEISAKVDITSKYLIDLQDEPKILWDAAFHLISAGGKRIRPLIAYQSAFLDPRRTPPEEDLLKVVSSLEFLHTFSLIHDDIMDKDISRRGVPSVHTKWDESTAILAGDLLFAFTFQIIDDTGLIHIQKAQISGILSKTSVKLCRGQMMDLSFENTCSISEEQYISMVELKTATLIEASAQIGGILGSHTPVEIEALISYGKNFGIAFQLIDDLLGLIGDQKKMGKPVGSDLQAGKKSYPIIAALLKIQADQNDEKLSFIQNVLNKKDNSAEELSHATEIVRDTGAIEKTRALAKYYLDDAKNALKIFPDSKYKQILLDLADYSLYRVN